MIKRQIPTTIGILIIVLITGVAGAGVLFFSQEDEERGLLKGIVEEETEKDKFDRWQLYQNKEFAFEMKYPNNYFKGIKTDTGTKTFVDFGEVYVFIETDNYIDEYIPSMVLFLSQHDTEDIKEKRNLSNKEEVKIGNWEVYTYDTFEMGMGITCESKEIVFPDFLEGDNLYFSISSCKEIENWFEESPEKPYIFAEEHLSEDDLLVFDQIVSTFRFLD